MLKDYVGKKVLIIGNHPWSGEIGKGKEVKPTVIGKSGLIVSLNNGTECFVFRESELQILKS